MRFCINCGTKIQDNDKYTRLKDHWENCLIHNKCLVEWSTREDAKKGPKYFFSRKERGFIDPITFQDPRHVDFLSRKINEIIDYINKKENS